MLGGIKLLKGSVSILFIKVDKTEKAAGSEQAAADKRQEGKEVK